MQIGFIGAGRIGRPMVARLVAAGHRVRVLDRSEAVRAEVAAYGALPVDDVAAVTEGAEAVLLCPYSDGQLRALCLDGELIDVLRPGSLLVVHTTASPLTITAIAERAHPRRIDVVDAPISGGPSDIEAGHVTVYTGADQAGIARARPLLSAYGDPIIHLGPTGAGQQVKLLNNAVFAANIGILAEAVRVAAQLGLDEGAILTGIAHGSGTSRALVGAAAAGSVAKFGEAVGEFVGKDVAVVKAVVAELGVDLGMMDAAHGVLAQLLSRTPGPHPGRTRRPMTTPEFHDPRRNRMKVRVDPAICQGHTLCAMNAPDLFVLSEEDGHASTVSEDVPPGREELVREAARSCPEQAIVIS